jgi:hypothetical protein
VEEMFFILMSLNLILYLATGFSLYKGNTKMAIIYGISALILSFLTFVYYKKKRRKHRSKKRENSSWLDCGNCGDVDCMDMDFKDGFDCIDIECGKMDCFELDCDGAECGGVDCNF